MIVKSRMLLFIMDVTMTKKLINVYRILVKNFLMKTHLEGLEGDRCITRNAIW
jgi:hypothetical protein